MKISDIEVSGISEKVRQQYKYRLEKFEEKLTNCGEDPKKQEQILKKLRKFLLHLKIIRDYHKKNLKEYL